MPTMPVRGLSRRGFLLGAAAFGGVRVLAAQDAVGALRDPSVVGRPRRPTSGRDNDAEIKAIEQRLACTCGCTLDIFTCRTTDFSCTYSPELHREVVALHEQGLTAQEIIDAFVAKYGEKALMAPKPQGFNLAGYLVPGILILVAAVLLAWVIGRRRRRAVAHADAAPADLASSDATPEEMERLRRALAEVED